MSKADSSAASSLGFWDWVFSVPGNVAVLLVLTGAELVVTMG